MLDTTNGAAYLKTGGTANTSWQKVLTASGTTAYTTGSILFANSSGNVTQDNQVLFYDSTNNRIGFGSNTPGSFAGLSTVRLEFADDTGLNSDVLQRVAGGGWGAYQFAASQGTKAAPTLISSSGNFGESNFSGYDGAAYREGAIIRGSVDGTPAANSMPGRLVFMTTPSGSVTSVERMRISANGIVNIIGTTTLSTTTQASSTILSLNSQNIFGTNNLFTNSTLTNATATNLFASNASITSLTVNTLSFNSINTGNGTITNSTSTNLFAVLSNFTTSIITSLTATNATFTSASTTNFSISNLLSAIIASFTNLTATNATLTSATSTNFFASTLFANSASITSATTTNFASTNATISSATITNLVSTNSTSTNLFANNFVSPNASHTIATTSRLNVTGDTAFSSFAASNLGSNGNITTQANIDAFTVINLNQTTANIVATIPSPTDTSLGKLIYINNVGTVSFKVLGSNIDPSTGRTFVWNGSAWSLMNELVGSGTQIKTKAADQAVTNNVTLATDTDLQFSIGANETIVFNFELLVSNNNSATPDWKSAIKAPTGSSCSVTQSGTEPAGTAFPQASSTNCITPTTMINNTVVGDAFVPFQVFIQGSVTNGANPGIVALQFAENTAGAGTSIVVKAGSTVRAYKTTGADLAEVYYTNDSSINEGDIISLAGGASQIEKSSKNYQSNTLGIISTKPGLVMAQADGTGKPVIVALSGRVPVKVSGINGNIKPGDYITASNIAGVGMKATEAGQVVGQALTEFVATSTESIGSVIVFIKNQYYDGGDDYLQTSTSTTLADGSIADRFTHLFRRAFEKITSVFLDMTLWVKTLRTDRVQTKELCIDDVCVTKQQLQQMLLNNSGNAASNSLNSLTNPTSTIPWENDQSSTTSATSTTSITSPDTSNSTSTNSSTSETTPETTTPTTTPPEPQTDSSTPTEQTPPTEAAAPTE
jgi:hypothetical protein